MSCIYIESDSEVSTIAPKLVHARHAAPGFAPDTRERARRWAEVGELLYIDVDPPCLHSFALMPCPMWSRCYAALDHSTLWASRNQDERPGVFLLTHVGEWVEPTMTYAAGFGFTARDMTVEDGWYSPGRRAIKIWPEGHIYDWPLEAYVGRLRHQALQGG